MTQPGAPLLPLPTVMLPAWRATALWVMVTLGLAAVMAEAWQAQVERGPFLRNQGAQRYLRHFALPAQRGAILDRSGKPLALSVPVQTLWVDPRLFNAQQAQWPQIASVLGVSAATLATRIRSGGSRFAFLARQIAPERAAAILALHIPGLYSFNENRRYYPSGSIAAPLLGFTNVDGRGIEGLELAYNQWLRGKAGEATGLRDNLGHPLAILGTARPAQPGQTLTLSIDRNIQYVAYTALASAVQRFQARSGAAVLMNARTGEILAMASYPSFNPNDRGDFQPSLYNNRAVADTLEPGSVMKPFTIAAALQDHVITMHSIFHTAPGCMMMYGNRICDDSNNGTIGLPQVIEYSSNVATGQIVMRMKPQEQWDMYTAVGFGQRPQVPFPGSSSGRLRPWKSWRPIDAVTQGFGYGLAVSTFQLAHAYLLFADDGKLPAATLLENAPPTPAVRLVSPEVAADIRSMLALVTTPTGTAPRAQVPGYATGGKTGTAYIWKGNAYDHHDFRAQFAGMVPINHPRLVMAVSVDQPQGARHFGGQIAAPVFSQVMAQALRILGVPPDLPVTPDVAPAGQLQAGAAG